MSDKSDSSQMDDWPAADDVRRVLDAEAAVRHKVERCREQLAEAVTGAQARAHRINQRTSERLGRLHARCDQTMKAQLAEMRASAQLPQIQPDEGDRQRLRDAVTELAARLTGPPDG